ncbi:DUF6537 domain-containing protein [Spirillospora sp. CA-253888]
MPFTHCGPCSAAQHALAVEIAELPDMIRGYEDVKTANVARYRDRLGELLTRWNSAPVPA